MSTAKAWLAASLVHASHGALQVIVPVVGVTVLVVSVIVSILATRAMSRPLARVSRRVYAASTLSLPTSDLQVPVSKRTSIRELQDLERGTPPYNHTWIAHMRRAHASDLRMPARTYARSIVRACSGRRHADQPAVVCQVRAARRRPHADAGAARSHAGCWRNDCLGTVACVHARL